MSTPAGDLAGGFTQVQPIATNITLSDLDQAATAGQITSLGLRARAGRDCMLRY
jgi:hypothetical protein